MSIREKYPSLTNQLFVWLGFVILFVGLLFNFFGEFYPNFRTFNYLFIIVDCVGAIIILLSLFFAFYSHRTNIKELRSQIFIESSLNFALNFSLQALAFHYLFHNSNSPAGLGIFFVFVAIMCTVVALFLCIEQFLVWKYKVTFLITICLVPINTTLSGIFLTFTGSNEQIVTEGISVFFLGLTSILFLIIGFIFYPKWKFLLKENGKEDEDAEEETDEVK